MAPTRNEITSVLPEQGKRAARSCFIPWQWIAHRHRDLPREQLCALFDAYSLILDRLDVPALIRDLVPAGEESDCRRCGSCCAELIPDPVLPTEVQRWEKAENPLALFYAPDPDLGPALLTGWTFRRIRLRLCPFLLWHPEHGDTFCALHPLGPEQRPEACLGYVPNYPHCAICQRPLVW